MSADVIVELYTKYQMLSFCICLCGISGVILIFVSIIVSFTGFVSCDWEWDGLNHRDRIGIVVVVFLWVITVILIVLAIYFDYVFEVKFKPEVARLVVPMGIDVANKMSVEVQDMLDLLKHLLSK